MSSQSSDSSDSDHGFDDWIEEGSSLPPCKSLFSATEFASVTEALEHDKLEHGFDLILFCAGWDLYRRIRLINHIRKANPTPQEVLALAPTDPVFADDAYLIPVIQDDPLLQFEPADSAWTDSEDEASQSPESKIKSLERKLEQAKAEFVAFRQAIADRALNAESSVLGPGLPSASSIHRDDDTHYFKSYGEIGIHHTMLSDKVRTSTYAQFILSTPELFSDAVVLDVGCGTGILSLFAARAGARKVFAIDASDIAIKAREVVKRNGFENVIEVIQGRVEDIQLPEKVDVIISEWMGYALLYESMLDSVLVARDRFLKSPTDVPATPSSEVPDSPIPHTLTGVLVPSQSHLLLNLVSIQNTQLEKDLFTFWDDVYGFDMSPIPNRDALFTESQVEVLPKESLLATDPAIVKDIHIGTIPSSSELDFTSEFTLVSTNEKKKKLTAFVVYFDTFFTPSGAPIPVGTKVKNVTEGDPVLVEVWQVGSLATRRGIQRRKSRSLSRKSSSNETETQMKRVDSPEGTREGEDHQRITSFSTSPFSIPTHWKQTVFLLREGEGIVLEEGTIVKGTFSMRKSEENTRELDVEIRWRVLSPDGKGKDKELDSTEEPEERIRTWKVR